MTLILDSWFFSLEVYKFHEICGCDVFMKFKSSKNI